MTQDALQLSRQYRNTLWWIVTLFVLTFFIILGLLLISAKNLNTEEIKHTYEKIENTLEQNRRYLQSQVRDYAIWDRAYQELVTPKTPDTHWIKSNFGSSLYENLNIDWAFVVKNKAIIFSSSKGQAFSIPDNYARFEESLLTNLSGAQFLARDGQLWLFSTHLIIKEESDVSGADTSTTLVFGRQLNSLLLEQIKSQTHIESFHFTDRPDSAPESYPLIASPGEEQIYLGWEAKATGTQRLLELLPGILILMLFLALATVLLVKRVAHQGKRSLKEMQSLAETRQALAKQQSVVLGLRQSFEQQHSQSDFMKELISRAQQLIKSDITSIWLLDDNENFITCAASNSAMTGDMLPAEVVDFCLSRLQEKSVIALNITPELAQHLPERSQGIMELMNDYSIRSVAMTAVYLGGQLRGVLTFGSLHHKSWSDADRNACSALAGVVAQFAETFQRRTLENDIYQKTFIDEITGLPHIAYINKHYADHLKNQRGYIAVFRIQGLHVINELHGLTAGNDALRQLAHFLAAYLSEHYPDVVLSRLPANRFSLFIIENQPVTEHLIQEIIELINQKFWIIKRKNFTLELQAGLASFPDDGNDIETLLHQAKLALQHVRSSLNKDFAFYSHAVHTGLKDRNDAIRELRTALEEEQFELYLQPQYDLHERIGGAEALVRWQHPTRGLLTPSHFIDLAEETELILPLGNWILRRACQLLETLPISLSVNMSVLQLKQDHFVDDLKQLMNEYNFRPEQLVLEIVESLMVEQKIKDKLVQIRKLGVEISLDDFGTGYSSLSYLQDLQLDELKVDQSFIRTLEHQDDAPLVRTIIAMAHTLNMRVVVEGIETQEQLDFVHSQGAELTQGYLQARPEPVEAFSKRLQRPALSAP